MSLFNYGDFKLHSGGQSKFFIDCSFLSRKDWKALARIVGEQVDFKDVIGIPSGGLRFAEALQSYRKDKADLPTLIVDDVLTTGRSMEEMMEEIDGECIGVVLFARGKCPSWVLPIVEIKIFE